MIKSLLRYSLRSPTSFHVCCSEVAAGVLIVSSYLEAALEAAHLITCRPIEPLDRFMRRVNRLTNCLQPPTVAFFNHMHQFSWADAQI